MNNGRYAHYSDNHFWDADLSANVALLDSSYALDDLKSPAPNARIRFNGATVAVTAAFDAAVSAMVLAVPVSNATSISVANGAGLSASATVFTMPSNRIPLTAVAIFASSSDDEWVITLATGGPNLTMAGGLWLSPYRVLNRNFTYGWTEREDQPGPEETNDYGADYVPNLTTQTREFEFTFPTARLTGLSELREWHRDGRKRLSFFQPNPNSVGANQNEAYIGRWVSPFAPEHTWLAHGQASLRFRESSKGKPV